MSSEPERATDPAKTVLIVEDDPEAREALRWLLQAAGYSALVAGDGEAGLQQALQHRPAMAIVDLGLPGLDGWQLAERLRTEFGHSIYLIAHTGHDSAEEHWRAVQCGFDVHSSKPLHPDTLLALLEARGKIVEE